MLVILKLQSWQFHRIYPSLTAGDFSKSDFEDILMASSEGALVNLEKPSLKETPLNQGIFDSFLYNPIVL